MENSMEIIENIMKPYFDKMAEIELSEEKKSASQAISKLKKERIEKKKSLRAELDALRLRSNTVIENFKDKMSEEIDEYIRSLNYSLSSSNFYSGYEAMIRKDLQQEYLKKLNAMEQEFKDKESALVDEINKLKNISEDEIAEEENLNSLKENRERYRNVYISELIEIKQDLKSQLKEEKERLNYELNISKTIDREIINQQIKYYQIKGKLSNFEYVRNDQGQIINGNEWNALFEESALIFKGIRELENKKAEQKKALRKIEKYLGLMELTQEETMLLIRQMSPLEKEEYDRRKNLSLPEETQEEEKFIESKEEPLQFENIESPLETQEELTQPVESEFSIDREVFDEIKQEQQKKLNEYIADQEENDIIEINDPVISNYNFDVIVEDKKELLKAIYNEIINIAQSMRAIKLNAGRNLSNNEAYISSKIGPADYKLNGVADLQKNETLELPCGEYINSDDISEAIKEFYKRHKGLNYKVKETKKEYKISRLSILKLKHELKKCSTVKLVKENKISKLDLMKVFGKQKSDKIMKQVVLSKSRKNDAFEGYYINRNEFISKLGNLLINNNKKLLSGKLKNENIKEQESEFDMEFKPYVK